MNNAKICPETSVLITLMKLSYFACCQIYLPTGGQCRITKRYNGVYNVHIYPSTYDFKQSEGLCGFFDGVESNDRQVRPGSTQTDPNLSWRYDEIAVIT